MVTTKKSAKQGNDWMQIHSTHGHGYGMSHTHTPKQLPGKKVRETRPTTTTDIDEADKALRDGMLRQRTNRQDKGGYL